MTSFGPCESWPVRWTCSVDTESPVVTGAAVAAATRVLWARTGRRFGECELTFRPCRRDCARVPWPEWSGTTWPDVLAGGSAWYAATCGVCSGECGCASLPEVVLPGVVSRVVLVRVDGAPLASGSYRVDDSRILVRTDGGSWPRCQDLVAADTEAGTWSVTARLGEAVPELGEMAIGELACELIRAFNGEDCRLPRQVTQLVRQGVSISMPDMADTAKSGLLGLFICDMFIKTENPHGQTMPSRVYDVDGILRQRRAGTT